MKSPRPILVALTLGSISMLILSCAPQQNSTAASQEQVVTVQRGDLSIDITAVGNLTLSTKEDLAFEIPGTVEEVMIKEGDSVQEGQALARLDTSEWEKQLITLERQVVTAERQVTSAEKQVRDKKTAVITAENQVISKEYALRQAELDLQTANNTLKQIAEVKKIQDWIDNAEYARRFAVSILTGGLGGASIDYLYWNQLKTNAEAELILANHAMNNLLSGASLTASNDVLLEVAKKQLAVEQKQLGIKQAQLDLDNAKQAVVDAQNAITSAQVDVKNAQDDMETAKKNLDDAKKNSPEVKAPFDGFITKVNVKGGDEVKKGTVAVQIADPTNFEAEILVSEMDIAKVKLDGTASVELQSATGVTLPAKVTHIAQTATVQQGVVNYKIKVELIAPQSALQARQQSDNMTSGSAPSGLPFSRGGAAFGSGNLTQEQINQIRQQNQQAGGGPPGGAGQFPGPGSLTPEQIQQMMQQRQQALAGATGQQGQTTAASASEIKLSEGMTVSVSLSVDSRTNVVRVLNSAITTRGGQTYVNVVLPDGSKTERQIQTGISDWQYTEVTSGLNEGEQVVISRNSATSTNSSTSNQQTPTRVPGGGVFFR